MGPATKILSILQNIDPEQLTDYFSPKISVSTWGFRVINPGGTKFDSLKHYLMQQQEVDQKEIDTLHEVIEQDAYDSDSLIGASSAVLSTRLPCNELLRLWSEQEKSL